MKTFIILVAICFQSQSSVDIEHPYRIWKDSKGKSTKLAQCVNIAETTVELSMKDGKVVSVPIDKLSVLDRKYIDICRMLEEDHRDFSACEYSRSQNESNLQKMSDAFKAINSNSKVSPYPPFFYGMSKLWLERDFEAASRQFERSIQRINHMQKLEGELHRSTLASALSNRAVCKLHIHDGNAAVRLLNDCCEPNVFLPLQVAHNAKVLQGIVGAGGTQFTIDNSSRKKLLKLLNSIDTSMVDPLPMRYVFSADINAPMSFAEVAKLVDASSVQMSERKDSENPGSATLYESPEALLQDGYESTVHATGFGLRENLVITSSSIVRNLPLKNVRYSTSVIGSADHANFQIADLVPVENSDRVAIFKVDKACPLLDVTDVEPSGLLSVYGFEGDRQAGFKPKKSPVELGKKIRGNVFGLNFVHEEESAGICVNLRGEVCGMAELPSGKIGAPGRSKEKTMYTSKAIMDEIKKRLPNDFENKPTGERKKEEQVVSALILVQSWEKTSQVQGSTIAPKSRVKVDPKNIVVDYFCMSCDGRGQIRCPGGCLKGKKTVENRVQIARDNAGRPVYDIQVSYVTCSDCTGRGSQDCPHCDHGTLSR